ncbi:MAG: FapA family protein [Spirochaetota bacterium]
MAASSFEKLKDAIRDISFDEQEAGDGPQSVEVEAYSIEEGLEKAAQALGLNISDLEYDILEQGKKSLLSRKPYRLMIKPVSAISGLDSDLLAGTEQSADQGVEALRKDADGYFRVKLSRVGVLLKVSPPRGRGKKVKVEEVLEVLSRRGAGDFDKSKIARIVREASGEYVKIAEFTPSEKSSARVVVEVTEDQMRAAATFIPPGPGGRDLDMDDVLDALNGAGVTVGINQEVIQESLEDEVYNTPIPVAEGIKPQHGEDARIEYHFRTEKKVHLEEDEKGQVDFKDLDLVENVVAGQLLATKVNATEGKPGRTVTNKLLEAKSGKDTSLNPGKNTELSADGMSVIATINGQVVLSNGKINVEPIYEVNGDVDMHTGNIVFLGTVIVKGNVEDGFSVKAAGDIDIRGSVGKCLLDAEGNINIKQGAMGKLGGTIKAGNTIWAKFLEQANVEAGKDVLVQDGIMHCQVDATEKVVCFGKRATIVGGKIRAGEIVTTKTLGSVSFTETVLEVGVDPKSRQRLYDLEKEKNESQGSLEKLNANINTLENQKRGGRRLSDDREELLEKMLSSRDELTVRLSEIDEEMNELKSYLKLLKTIGKVAVSKNVYPGVRIAIKDIYYDVTNEFKYVTFVLEGGRIRMKKYEEVNVPELAGKKVR